MPRRLSLTFVLMALFCTTAHAESISYEIYRLRSDGSRQIVSSGTRHYELDDIERSEKLDRSSGDTWTDASLVLDGGYSIGGSFYREPNIEGFALWIKRSWNPFGFSWEWFDRTEGRTFGKRQVGGRIEVRTIRVDELRQIVAVRFLTDVTLRYSWLMGLEHSLFVEVKAGSVFRHAP